MPRHIYLPYLISFLLCLYHIIFSPQIQQYFTLVHLCQENLHMKPNGFDRASSCLMWRCPYGKEHCSKYKNSCTSSKYDRIIKTRPEWDIRLYTNVPCGTDAYKKIYNQRSATEHFNNHILNDYGLHRMFIHTKKHYSFMSTIFLFFINLQFISKSIVSSKVKLCLQGILQYL